MILTHGAGMDHTMWRDQAESLRSAGYRVVVWDLRGHGQSELAQHVRFTASDALEDLAAVLDAADLTSAVLVGHSLGGNLAQRFAREHPGRVRGLIVMDSTWNTGPLRLDERLGLRLAAPVLAMIPGRRLPGLMARASAVSPHAIAEIEAVFERMPPREFVDVWRATASLVAPDPDYRTSVPLALIRGQQDRTGNIATAVPRWARAEGVEEQVIPNAGHVVTLDDPAATTKAILHTLARWNDAAPRIDCGGML